MAKPKSWKQDYLAWAAGFFEGEGGVPLARLQFIFGGIIRETKQCGGFARGNTIFRWVIASKQALHFLQQIKPYLSSKQEEVALAREVVEASGKGETSKRSSGFAG